MQIKIRLFGELKQYQPEGERRGRAVRIEVPDGLSAQQLILHLGIPYGGDEGQMVVAVNDVEVDHGKVLRDGDTVSLFEPLAGG
ncbi:MAG: MoaD/ThiS family protein [Armatimonadota bacterium]